MDQFVNPADRITQEHVKQMAAAYNYYFGEETVEQAVATVKLTESKEEKDEKESDKKEDGEKSEKKDDDKKEDKDEKKDKKSDKKDKKPEDKGGEEDAKDADAENKNYVKADKKDVKESKFETHVVCSKCGSHDQTLSVKRTKIKCNDCDNVDLIENIIGVK